MAGIRTPHPIADLDKEMPQVYKQLREITNKLEQHYRDVQDFEFTVQEGTLYMLQTRTGKRTAHAAVKIAVDMVGRGSSPRKRRCSALSRRRSISCSIPSSIPRQRSR